MFIFLPVLFTTILFIFIFTSKAPKIINNTQNVFVSVKALLTTQRKAQMEAIKHLLSINHNEKQHDMLNIMTRKLLEVGRLVEVWMCWYNPAG